MTAVNNIRYYKTSMCHSGRGSTATSIAARCIGASDNSLSSVIRRINELKETKVPTVVEICGIENDYIEHKAQIDRLFTFLSLFSRRYRLVRFTVMIGNMRYVL